MAQAQSQSPATRKRSRHDPEDLTPLPEERDDGKLSKSCDVCKLKKIKCDGVKPYCSFCLKNGLEGCNYSYVKKPGLKPGYGKGMSQRMDLLENELLKLRKEVASIKTQASAYQLPQQRQEVLGALTRPPISTAPQQKSPLSSRAAAQASPDSTRSFQRQLPIPTLLNPDHGHRFVLPSESQCLLLIDLFFAKVAPIFPLLHPSVAEDLGESVKSLRQGTEPPMTLYAIVLISLKFLGSDQMTPEDMKACYEACKETVISSVLKKVSIENLQAMILLAYESLSGSVKVPEAWNYVSIAADYAAYLKLGSEKAIRVAMVSGDSPESNTSVHSTGDIARRKSKSISNRSLNLLRKPKDWVDEECRRHCFWCIYILDKIFAISSSHEMKLKSFKITSLLPLKLSFWNSSSAHTRGSVFHPASQQSRTLRSVDATPRNDFESPQAVHSDQLPSSIEVIYDSFAFYIELNKIVGDIHTFLIEEFNIYNSTEVMTWRMRFKTLENQLLVWVTSLPLKYQHFLETGSFPRATAASPGCNTSLQPYDCLLYVFYYTALIKLHSSFGYPHGESEHFRASEDSKMQCLECVKKVFNFVNELPLATDDPDIFAKLGPHFGFFIWVSSRILFVNVVYQSTNHSFVESQLEWYQKVLVTFSEVLFKIGCFWESSMVYYKILQFLNASDLSYVTRFSTASEKTRKDPEEGDSNSDEEENITGATREPAKVFSDMRIGSHSLLFWFNKLASRGEVSHDGQTPLNGVNMNIAPSAANSNGLFENTESMNQALVNFQTSSALAFDEFQLTHDDFFNFLAMDINGSGSFQNTK